MIIPTKHEKLGKNLLVIGADIISIVRRDRQDIQTLFSKIRERKQIDLDQFYNAITFLWLADIITRDGYFISIKK